MKFSTRRIIPCERCKARKRRCDWSLPECSSCKNAGVECVTFDPFSQKEIPRIHVYNLEYRVSYLESLLSNNGITYAYSEDFDQGTESVANQSTRLLPSYDRSSDSSAVRGKGSNTTGSESVSALAYRPTAPGMTAVSCQSPDAGHDALSASPASKTLGAVNDALPHLPPRSISGHDSSWWEAQAMGALRSVTIFSDFKLIYTYVPVTDRKRLIQILSELPYETVRSFLKQVNDGPIDEVLASYGYETGSAVARMLQLEQPASPIISGPNWDQLGLKLETPTDEVPTSDKYQRGLVIEKMLRLEQPVSPMVWGTTWETLDSFSLLGADNFIDKLDRRIRRFSTFITQQDWIRYAFGLDAKPVQRLLDGAWKLYADLRFTLYRCEQPKEIMQLIKHVRFVGSYLSEHANDKRSTCTESILSYAGRFPIAYQSSNDQMLPSKLSTLWSLTSIAFPMNLTHVSCHGFKNLPIAVHVWWTNYTTCKVPWMMDICNMIKNNSFPAH